jgi:hypothetical protein
LPVSVTLEVRGAQLAADAEAEPLALRVRQSRLVGDGVHARRRDDGLHVELVGLAVVVDRGDLAELGHPVLGVARGQRQFALAGGGLALGDHLGDGARADALTVGVLGDAGGDPGDDQRPVGRVGGLDDLADVLEVGVDADGGGLDDGH